MKKKFAIVLALFLIAVVCSAGCIDPQEPVDPVVPVDPIDPITPVDPVVPVDPEVPAEEYSVMFMLNYGDAGAYSAETVKAGETVSKPATPSRSGYTFKGWFTAAEGGAAYDFTQPVNADVTLYAQWSKKSSSSGGSSTPSHSHSYGNWVSNNDGTHSKTCSSGDSTVTADCTFSGYTCTLCSYEDTVYHISNLTDLQTFAATVNNGDSFSGKTVKLEADISLVGVEWSPIGTTSNTFAGTFDGNDKTISNLAIEGTEKLGFFGELYGTVKNLTVDGVTITGNHYLGGIAGFGLSGLITDCTVKNAVITATPNKKSGGGYDNGDKVGGIVGYGYCDAENHDGLLTVSNCFVADSTITGFRDVGGIAGAAQGDAVTGNTVSNVTVVVDRATNYYSGYDTITGGEVLGRLLDSSALGTNTATDSTVIVKYASGFEVTDDGENDPSVEISSADGMIFAASSNNPYGAWGAAGTGSQTYSLVGDIDMTGKSWTPVKIDGYHGADIFTLEGNGATITGLTTPLFAGGFAGDSGIVIKNLTIADSVISSASDQGSGAFIECADSMDVITLTNCHLVDSTVMGSRTGGLIGWTSGYNNQNDGPVKSYITVESCSVVDCTILGSGSVGGLCGHAGANAWTYSTFTNCVVRDTILSSTDTGSWKVGVVVGTANVGEVTISNIEESGNTLIQTGKTAPEGEYRNLYGRFVPGTTGKLMIDGVGILADGSKVVDGITYKPPVTVKAAEGKTAQEVFNEALTAASSEANTVNTINLPGGEYIIDDAAKGKTLTIVGNGQDTVINSVDDGASEGDGDYSFDGSTVTFEGVTITTETTYFPGYVRMKGTYNNCTINGVWTLYDNSTFNNCTFNVQDDIYNVCTWGATEATFNKCTFNNDGKAILLYGTVNTKLTLNNCVFNDNGGLTDLKAAVETGNDYGKSYELIINNCKVNGYEINDKGINTGTTLWANKNSMGTDKLNVVVDGVDVY